MKILVDFITDTLAFLPTVIFWRFYIIREFARNILKPAAKRNYVRRKNTEGCSRNKKPQC